MTEDAPTPMHDQLIKLCDQLRQDIESSQTSARRRFACDRRTRIARRAQAIATLAELMTQEGLR